jgi:hypothetical protein
MNLMIFEIALPRLVPDWTLFYETEISTKYKSTFCHDGALIHTAYNQRDCFASLAITSNGRVTARLSGRPLRAFRGRCGNLDVTIDTSIAAPSHRTVFGNAPQFSLFSLFFPQIIGHRPLVLPGNPGSPTV